MMEELLKVFEKDHDLGDKAKAMWSEGASAIEIAEALTEAGHEVGADQVEPLLASLQASSAKAVVDNERVDRGQLKAVAGGWTCGENYAHGNAKDGDPLGGCDSYFYSEPCSATVERGSWCWSNDMCAVVSSLYHCEHAN